MRKEKTAFEIRGRNTQKSRKKILYMRRNARKMFAAIEKSDGGRTP